MSDIKLKKVTVDDIGTLQDIGKKTFVETFALHNTEDNMHQYLAEGFTYNKLKRELESAGSEFVFAVQHGEVVGYLKLNSGDSQTEIGDENALEIERIYVLQQCQGTGVGASLFQYALNAALQKKAHYIWLGVWEENKKAIQFYTKHGLAEFDRHIFKLGNDLQTDIMMKRYL